MLPVCGSAVASYRRPMGWFDDFTDFVEDTADVVVDVASDAAGAVGDVADAAVTAVGQAAAAAGGVVTEVAGFADDLSGGVFGGFLDVADDLVFDNVDYLTGGVVDIDYDDGGFGVSLGVDGVMSFGASVGEAGVGFESTTLISGFEASANADGLSVSGSAGIDFGPLPYAEGHVDISPNGDISIGGELQGTVPTPWGMLSGAANGGFVKTDAGYAVAGDIDATLTLPSGTQVGGGLSGNLSVEADGDTSYGVGANAFVGQVGVGRVGVGFEHQRVEDDGNVFEQTSANASASGFGMSAQAGVEHTEVELTDGRSFSNTATSADIQGFDSDSILQLGTQLLGAAGVDVPTDAGGLLEALGADGMGDLVGALTEGGQLDSFVSSLGADGVSGLIGKAMDGGVVHDLLGGLGDDAIGSVLGQLAETGGLGDVLGALDADATAGLVSRLVAGPAAGSGQAAPQAAPSPAATGADVDVLGAAVYEPSAAAGFSDDLPPAATWRESGAAAEPPLDEWAADDNEMVAYDPPPVEPAPESEAVTEFDTAVAAADTVAVEADALFDDL
jgi:hypothetical protein